MNDHPDFDDVIDNWATMCAFDLEGTKHFPVLYERLVNAGFCMDRLEEEELPEPTPRELLTAQLMHPSSPIRCTGEHNKDQTVAFVLNTCDELGLFEPCFDPEGGDPC